MFESVPIFFVDSGKVCKVVMNGTNSGEPYLAEEIQATQVLNYFCYSLYYSVCVYYFICRYYHICVICLICVFPYFFSRSIVFERMFSILEQCFFS